jgi:hypothetical protein
MRRFLPTLNQTHAGLFSEARHYMESFVKRQGFIQLTTLSLQIERKKWDITALDLMCQWVE